MNKTIDLVLVKIARFIYIFCELIGPDIGNPEYIRDKKEIFSNTKTKV